MKVSLAAIGLFLVVHLEEVGAIKSLQRQRNGHEVEIRNVEDVITEEDIFGEEQSLWQRILADTGVSMPLSGKKKESRAERIARASFTDNETYTPRLCPTSARIHHFSNTISNEGPGP